MVPAGSLAQEESRRIKYRGKDIEIRRINKV